MWCGHIGKCSPEKLGIDYTEGSHVLSEDRVTSIFGSAQLCCIARPKKNRRQGAYTVLNTQFVAVANIMLFKVFLFMAMTKINDACKCICVDIVFGMLDLCTNLLYFIGIS